MDVQRKPAWNDIAEIKRNIVIQNAVLRIIKRPSAVTVFGKKTKIDPPTKDLRKRAIPAVRHDCCVLCGRQVFVFFKALVHRAIFFSFRRDGYAFAGGSSGRDFNSLL